MFIGAIYLIVVGMFDEIREERLKKLELLKSKGINPYPSKTARTHTILEVLESFDDLEKKKGEVTISGRVMARRGQGAIVFVDLYDGTDRMQSVLKEDEMDEEHFTLFKDAIDTGDIVEITGTVFTTKRGEKSVQAKDWGVLTKTLIPLPDKWHGLKDDELRLRKRHVDILMNTELRELFEKKARFWQEARWYLIQNGFTEVQTPTLEITTGGAEARPFVTHHNDYDMDMYLRISVGELWQKRLMSAGFPRTFEIGRIYRNEGSSPEHLQEFTNIEFYAAYMDFDEGLTFIENHFKHVLKEVFDDQKEWEIHGHKVDFSGDWKRIDYSDTVKEMTGVDVLSATEDEMKAKLTELKVSWEGDTKERLTDTLWKYCRKQIAGPVWLVNHPKLVSPLSKEHPDDSNKTLRAQLIIAGSELNNCYAELNDPIDQKKRFEEQQELLKRGDDEAMMPDFEFVEMLEQGMPPTFGASTVSERFFAFLMDKNIRETQLFPLMKPHKEESEES